MIATLFALVLAAAPAEPVSTAQAAPRAAVWTQPVGTVVSGLAGGPVYIPVGANVPLSGSTSLGLELSLVFGSMRDPEDDVFGAPPVNFWRVLAAVGPVFSLRGEPLSGPFLQPKVLALYSREPEYAFEQVFHQGGSSLEVQLGLDAGWQFSFGDWYLAPVVGAGTAPTTCPPRTRWLRSHADQARREVIVAALVESITGQPLEHVP